METSHKTSAKDFFLNLGAVVGLYVVISSLVNLLFTVINRAYPQTTGYGYLSSYSISWPVAMLIILTPIFILFMWILEKEFTVEPEKRNLSVRKWLTYITLFVSGGILAGDLVTVLYYFLDGQDLTAGFLLKVLTVLVVTVGVFFYYISEIRGTLTSASRKIWIGILFVVIAASIVLGFAVIGSPATQRGYKYDEKKVMDLMALNNRVGLYFTQNQTLPKDLAELTKSNQFLVTVDPQTEKSYEYIKLSEKKYQVCAEFNDKSQNVGRSYSYIAMPVVPGNFEPASWEHPAGRYCFDSQISDATPGMKI